MREKLTIEDILEWIFDNRVNEEAMEKINRLTFTFTPKYRKYTIGGKSA